MTGAKPFAIPKWEVWDAFKRVKANQGAAGVDGQSIQDFETRLAGNLYKLWNRLSSGSHMPPPPPAHPSTPSSRRRARGRATPRRSAAAHARLKQCDNASA